MLDFLKRSIKHKELSHDFRKKVIYENSLWSLILLILAAISQIILIIIEALGAIPWDSEIFIFRLITIAISAVFSTLLMIARKRKAMYTYLKFIMASLNITVLACGVFFVIYFLSNGIFSFTVFLLVVYLLSISYIVRPCYFTIIYFLVFAALITHIFSNYESSSMLISEIIISGVFLLLMAAGSSLSYSRYWKLFLQEKEIEEINQKLELISQTDELTGLFNRKRIMEEIEKQIAYSQRYEHIFSVAIVDIDYFKNINDTYGHDIGDVVLREFAGLLNSKLRLSDFCGRWGGEEFILLLPGTPPDDSFILLKRLQNDIGNHVFPNGIKVAFSAGICGYQTGADMNKLIKYADQALYSAKTNGRNRTEIFSITKE